MSERLLLSLGEMTEQGILAVITRGGHPVVDPGVECEVLDAAYFPTAESAHAWFDEMQIMRPWETRS